MKNRIKQGHNYKNLIINNFENLDPQLIKNKCFDQYKKQIQIEQQKTKLTEKEQYQYKQQILSYLLNKVQLKCHNGHYNFFNFHQTDISEHMRIILMNWLIDVHLKYRLQPETLFITFNIIDCYLDTQVINRKQLQLLGITSLWIAAKYEQTYQVPKLHNLVCICDSTYPGEQILKMESMVLLNLNFDLLKINVLHYYEIGLKFTTLSVRDYYFGRYLLEVAQFNIEMRKYSSKMIAFATILFIHKLGNYSIEWDQQLQTIYGFNEKQLKPCAKDLCYFWQQIEMIQSLQSLKKKFMAKQYYEVSKIKLSNKKY